MIARRIVMAFQTWRTARLVARLKREKAAEQSETARFARVGMHMAGAQGPSPKNRRNR